MQLKVQQVLLERGRDGRLRGAAQSGRRSAGEQERLPGSSRTDLARGRETGEPDGRALLAEQRRALLGGDGCGAEGSNVSVVATRESNAQTDLQGGR